MFQTVFCSESVESFPGMASRFSFKPFVDIGGDGGSSGGGGGGGGRQMFLRDRKAA